ncbi:MAG: hypothetical protein IV100_14420 [Myxococcales bacterium]|nr:hypothetical protein [Myxococcales bacterium]
MPRIESLTVTLRRADPGTEGAGSGASESAMANAPLELWLEFNGHRIAALASVDDRGGVSAKFWPRSMSHSVALVAPSPALWGTDPVQVAIDFDTDGGAWRVDFEPEPLVPGELIDIWAERPTPIWRV